jgi:pimeloyl-ACP methyl ester carboxylesterase
VPDVIADMVDVNGIGVYFEDGGAGQPILAIHGFGSSAQSWRPIRRFLPGHRIIAPSLKGAGWSDKPDDGHYGVPEQARLMVALADRLGLRAPVVLGHSFGGAVALETAARLQESLVLRPVGLILINSIAFEQRIPLYMTLLRTPRVGEAFCGLLQSLFAARIRGRVPTMPPLPLQADALPETPHCLLLPGGPEAFLCTARQMIDYPVGELRCGSLQMPTLVLRGPLDPVVPANVAQMLVDSTPHARLVVLPGCGHLPHEQHPHQTACAIATFLHDVGIGAPSPPPLCAAD